MALFKLSLLFDFTTQPQDTRAASAHSGGWSESLWTTTSIDLATSASELADIRAPMLTGFATIIGWRAEQFTISGNKLLPGGTSGGRFIKPGQGGPMNLAQDALMLSGKASGAINTNHFSLRGMPDGNIQQGEYVPSPGFVTGINRYIGGLTNGLSGFVGRKKSNTTQRVNLISAGVVTLAANIGGVAGSSYLRLLRCRGDNGQPIKGSFLITGISGAEYTVQGLAGVALSTPNGLARLDEIAYFPYDSIKIQRAVSKKVGRPFESYRGRASRRR